VEDSAKLLRGEKSGQDYYYSFLQRESREKQSEEYQRSQRYFRQLLGDEHWYNVPTPDHGTWETEPSEEALDMELTLQDMAKAGARHGASGNVLCITAAILALQEYCHRHRILVKWLNSNRGEGYYDNTIGLLFRILPVAVHTERFKDLGALIAEVNRQVAEGFANSSCNYMEDTEQALEDSLEVNYLVGMGEDNPLAALGGEALSPDYHYDAVGERVGVYIERWENTLGVTIEYQKKAYADGSMARFLEMFKKYLRYIVLE
jgi:bacitracin synthase 3